MYSAIECFTPKMAMEILSKDHSNRPLRWRKVQDYAADMKHGRWRESNNAICFDTNGTLINGQHRLQAWKENEDFPVPI